MNDKVYPPVELVEVPKIDYPDNYIYAEEWHRCQYRYMKLYFEKVLSGWSVVDFFYDILPGQIAVYAMTDFAECIIKDLQRKGGREFILADGKPENYKKGFFGLKVYSAYELFEKYKNGDIKKIVVCSIFHANEIMQFLLDIGFNLSDIITIKTVIFN